MEAYTKWYTARYITDEGRAVFECKHRHKSYESAQNCNWKPIKFCRERNYENGRVVPQMHWKVPIGLLFE